MIYTSHASKKEWKRTLCEVYAMEPVELMYNSWSEITIMFDRCDHLTSIRLVEWPRLFLTQ